jgi:hypothetical protein
MAIDYEAAATAYYDNADYEETGSVAKAKAFVTACRQLIGRPTKAGHGQASVEHSPDALREQMAYANEWLAANDTTNDASPGVRFHSFKRYRT